ncbi:dienelactone hydrolase family protein [Bradyrhizobium sp.]|uniref:dienelactone hydrolase family protein n=1 Tax=Bradyrhizobium sp. TaxID=376 RepID=UPI003C737BB1
MFSAELRGHEFEMAWTNLLRRLWTLGSQRLCRLPAPVFLVSVIVLGARCEAAETISIKSTRSFGLDATYLKAELFKPEGKGPFPAVVLMHGCGGWQPAVLGALHEHAWYFLDRGYVVLNLDSFGPRGNSGGTVCESDAKLVNALDYRTNDAFDALHYLQTLQFVDPKSTFLMGQSNGGSVAINAAKMAGPRGFRAVAAYYPWCGSLGASSVKLTSPLIIFSGSRDDWVPARQCRNRMSMGEQLKVVAYPNAPHSFDLQIKLQRYLGKLIGFDKSATEDSRAQMLAFFNGQLEKNVQRLSKLDAAGEMSQ